MERVLRFPQRRAHNVSHFAQWIRNPTQMALDPNVQRCRVPEARAAEISIERLRICRMVPNDERRMRNWANMSGRQIEERPQLDCMSRSDSDADVRDEVDPRDGHQTAL